MRGMCGALVALVWALGLSTPADAKMVYRWETDEGVVSFADELKRRMDERKYLEFERRVADESVFTTVRIPRGYVAWARQRNRTA